MKAAFAPSVNATADLLTPHSSHNALSKPNTDRCLRFSFFPLRRKQISVSSRVSKWISKAYKTACRA